MGAQGIEAGKAYVKFLLDDKGFKKGLASISAKMQSIGKIGLAATAPLVAGFTAATAAFVSAGDELDKMSARTGFSAEALSELKYAAGQSGTSIGAVEKAAKRMQVGILDASKGTGTLFESLQQLGVDLELLKQQSPEQQFLTLSRAIGSIEDPTLKSALAQKVFGKSGTELLPLLNAGAEGMDALRKRAHELGLVLTTEDATAAAILGDNLDDLKLQVMAMATQVGSAIAGPLTDFAKSLQETLASVISWIKRNPDLVKSIAAITSVALVASAAVTGIGIALAAVGSHPILAAIAAVATGAYAIKKAFDAASDSVEKTGDTIRQLRRQNILGPATGGGGRVRNSLEERDWIISNSEAWKEGQRKIAESQQRDALAGPNASAPFANQPGLDPWQQFLSRAGLGKHPMGAKDGALEPFKKIAESVGKRVQAGLNAFEILPGFDVNDALGLAERVMGSLQVAFAPGGALSSMGTFNGSNILGLQAGGSIDKDLVKQGVVQSNLLRKILDEVKEGWNFG